MLKIAFISLDDPEDQRAWSGTPYNTLITLRKKHEVDWITPRGSNNALIERAYQGFRLISRQKRYPYHTQVYAKALARNLNNRDLNDYDLIFSIGSSEISYLKTTTPIVHLTDATYQQMIGYYKGFDISARHNRNADEVQNAAYERSSQIIFASRWAANSALEHYNVPEEKVNVVRFGPNLAVPSIAPEAVIDNQVRMLFVGKEWGRKGGPIALETYKALEKAGVDVSLTIVGCDPAEAKGAGKGIKVMGYVQNLSEVYERNNIFLLPTRAECAGIVFCEASAFGLPCFTTDTGGVPDYVENGVNGYRLGPDASGKDYADKIISAFESQDNFLQLRRRARDKYERELNWGRWLESFETIAKKAMS